MFSALIRGRVDRVIHTNGSYNVLAFFVLESNGWRQRKPTKVTGNFFGLSRLTSDTTIELAGEWGTHAKYGRQFKAYSWMPWAITANDVLNFLKNCIELGADQSLLKRIVDRFGLKTFEALSTPAILEIASDEKEQDVIREIGSKWSIIRGIAALADFLQEFNFSPSVVSSVFYKFGIDAIKFVSENIYRLVEIEGVPFGKVDTVALKKGYDAGDSRRVAGGVFYVIRDQVKQQGDLFVRRGDISYFLNELSLQEQTPVFITPNIDHILNELESSGAVKIEPNVGVYIPEMHLYEHSSAKMLSKFLTPMELVIDLDAFLKGYEKANDITLSSLQKEAVIQLLAHRVLVVTGAPGTGKTTLVRAFVQLFQRLGITYMLMAPTGIAAKRLSSVTNTTAQTVHRALEYDGFSWGRDETCPLDARAIICDEVSMLDQEVFYRLLCALTPDTMLVLVGDDAQLPSVGPGNVLKELLACKAISHVRLDQIFRQAETSDIILAAHKIKRGASPLDLPAKQDAEFRFVRVKDEKTIADMIVQMAIKLKSRDANFQVLAPKYEGIVGVDNLNTLIREQLNPDKGQPNWNQADFSTRVGDRLMVIKNNYKLNVYNGDIGKLIEITRDGLVLRIHSVGHIPETRVIIPKEQAITMLKLAYAVTVHRCQGEEFETVVMPLVRTQGRMLQRNLFYTAVTRARKKVWVLGDIDAVLKAVANDKVIQRNTVLRDLIMI